MDFSVLFLFHRVLHFVAFSHQSQIDSYELVVLYGIIALGKASDVYT